MGDFNDFVGEDINDLGWSANGFEWRKIATLKVSVSVKVVPGFCDADEPIYSFESLMRQCILIVNSKGRRMGNEDVQGAPIIHLI